MTVSHEVQWNRGLGLLLVKAAPKPGFRKGLSARFYAGARDGTASGDRYARGDIWVLRTSPDEIDDQAVADSDPRETDGTKVRLGAFLNRQPVKTHEITTWYAGHFKHRARTETGREVHRVGPKIVVTEYLRQTRSPRFGECLPQLVVALSSP